MPPVLLGRQCVWDLSNNADSLQPWQSNKKTSGWNQKQIEQLLSTQASQHSWSLRIIPKTNNPEIVKPHQQQASNPNSHGTQLLWPELQKPSKPRAQSSKDLGFHWHMVIYIYLLYLLYIYIFIIYVYSNGTQQSIVMWICQLDSPFSNHWKWLTPDS